MKNNLADLNDHLFAALEDLDDTHGKKLSDKELDRLVKKSRAISSLSTQILRVAQTQINAIKTAEACRLLNQDMPSLLAIKDSKTEQTLQQKEKQKLLGGLK